MSENQCGHTTFSEDHKCAGCGFDSVYIILAHYKPEIVRLSGIITQLHADLDKITETAYLTEERLTKERDEAALTVAEKTEEIKVLIDVQLAINTDNAKKAIQIEALKQTVAELHAYIAEEQAVK